MKRLTLEVSIPVLTKEMDATARVKEMEANHKGIEPCFKTPTPILDTAKILLGNDLDTPFDMARKELEKQGLSQYIESFDVVAKDSIGEGWDMVGIFTVELAMHNDTADFVNSETIQQVAW